MIEELVEVVEAAPVTGAPDDALAWLGLLDRVTAKATLAMTAVLSGGEWAADGDVSPSVWLRRTAGLSAERAFTLARTARRVHDLPATAGAWADGVLSSDQVACITGVASDRRRPLLAEHEADLLPTWVSLTPAELTIVMRKWAACADDVLDRERPDTSTSKVWLSATLDGRGVLKGDLDPLARDTLAAALALTGTYDGDTETRSTPQRLADALVELARQHLDRAETTGGRRNRPQVSVMIDLADLEGSGRARLLDGTPLTAASTRQLLCDAEVHRILTDGPGVILDLGRTERLVSRHQWHALVLRDRGCRHPGCDRPHAWCHAHHVVPWEHGGPTDLNNLVLKCSRHHHLGHQPGWHDKLLPDGVYEITTPTGTTLTSRPPP